LQRSKLQRASHIRHIRHITTNQNSRALLEQVELDFAAHLKSARIANEINYYIFETKPLTSQPSQHPMMPHPKGRHSTEQAENARQCQFSDAGASD